MAKMPDNVVASPYDGIKNGSIVMMNMPKPKPVVRCTKLAPMLNRNMAITILFMNSVVFKSFLIVLYKLLVIDGRIRVILISEL